MLETIPPLAARPEVMDFFLTRRSRPARTLTLPVPTRDQLLPILTAAVRVPDHGKLEPWRLIVLEKPALDRLAALARERGEALGMDADRSTKGVAQFTDSNLAIVVVKTPRPTDKIPQTEQILSTGAVCLTLLNAAQAAGWGANWLTGWMYGDADFTTRGLGLHTGEWVAGVIHIGTEGAVPPDRPRPDLARIVTWVAA
ncbi:MAG TPA: nitroreductase [Paracoccaceae bacterium]|nr:nitroreductase [Paracoccaceae bacterium]